MGEPELPEYAFNVIAEATNNFSPFNKLGEGGFGPVYKVSFIASVKCYLIFSIVRKSPLTSTPNVHLLR